MQGTSSGLYQKPISTVISAYLLVYWQFSWGSCSNIISSSGILANTFDMRNIEETVFSPKVTCLEGQTFQLLHSLIFAQP